jgi:hypothetical protein
MPALRAAVVPLGLGARPLNSGVIQRCAVPEARSKPPQFKSPLLAAISAAFLKRRKAIRHKTKSLQVERSSEDSGFEPPERLNVETATTSVRIRLSVWPDGVLWFWAGRPSKKGWTFQIAFHGKLRTAGAAGVVSRFESSLGLLYDVVSASDCEKRLLSLWGSVEPKLDRAD